MRYILTVFLAGVLLLLGGPAEADFTLQGPITFKTPDFAHSGSTVSAGGVTFATAGCGLIANGATVSAAGYRAYTDASGNVFLSAADNYVALTNALTASRTWTLPLAANVAPGCSIKIAVESTTVGSVTDTNQLIVAAGGSDLINGEATYPLTGDFFAIYATSDGVAHWTVTSAMNIPSASNTPGLLNYVPKWGPETFVQSSISDDGTLVTISNNLSLTGLSPGSTVSCAGLDSGNHLVLTGAPCGSGSGSVTSVGFAAPGGGVFGASGTPVTGSGTLTLTATGTSGGILYFPSASTIGSSAVLTANAPVIGGGAGIAPSVGTRSGNTTSFATVSGVLTSGHVAVFDASGNVVDGGAAPASGTVTSVGFSVPATSIFGVTGSPVTGAGTLGLTTTVTSGGLLYGSSATQVASSALLAANQLILGGGAGTAPVTLGSLGTTTTVLHGNAAGAPTFGAVANADLVNSSTTVNGQTCTLGSSCTVTASATGITVGSTTVSSGTNGGILYDNGGTLGNSAAITSNVLVKGGGTGAPVASSITDDGTTVSTSEVVNTGGVGVTSGSATQTIPNNGSTAPVLNKIAKMTAGAYSATVSTTSDTTNPIGICIGNCSTSGNATIAFAGLAACVFDGATTAGDFVIVSTTTGGDCHDGGSTPPANVAVLGQVTSTNGGAGTYTVDMNPVGVMGAGGGNSGGKVNSVSNSDGTITFSPTTGAVVGSLALSHANSWTGAQRGTPVNIAISTATFTPNFNTGQNFEIDLTSACPCTLANPSTTLVAGQSGMIEIHQDGSGSRTIGTWGTDYLFVGGTSTITLSTAASAVDYLPYYVNNAATGIVLGSPSKAPTH